jgi:DNA-binding transcriptional ArsR family regulator
MLRIHFTAEDLGKVRLAAQPDPLWETVFSLFRLRMPSTPLVFAGWRRRALPQVRRPDLDLLLSLAPGSFYPDFLTPPEGALGLDAGLDALLSTPRSRLLEELRFLAEKEGPLPSWTAQLAAGDCRVLKRLAGAIRTHHDAVVAPFWHEAQAYVEADRAKRAKAVLEGGCEGLLRSYQPMIQWRPPVLEIDVRIDQTTYLDGRGLLLQPAFLSWKTPDILHDPEQPPILVYPVEHDLALSARTRAPHASLAALIGATRVAVLSSVGVGRTTTELARRVGVTAGSISQHTTVLREARLIRTSRVGKAVIHTMTPLGTALLESTAAVIE